MELHSTVIFYMINGINKVLWKLQHIIEDIQQKKSRRNIEVNKWFGEGNVVAETLNNLATTIQHTISSSKQVIFSVMPKVLYVYPNCRYQPLEKRQKALILVLLYSIRCFYVDVRTGCLFIYSSLGCTTLRTTLSRSLTKKIYGSLHFRMSDSPPFFL